MMTKYKHTNTWKSNMSVKLSGKNNPMYGKTGERSPRFGRHQSEHQKDVASKTHKNKVVSKETREKMRVAKSGIIQSDKTKLKRRLALKGQKRTAQTKEKQSIRAFARGTPWSWINAARKANTGRKLSDEHKRKMRIWKANVADKFKDTKIELALQQELTKRNIQFKKHVPLIGQPDIFVEPNICIFADGDMYHAHPDKYKADDIVPKINMFAKDKWEYDKNITNILLEQNYKVLRFWERDINKSAGSACDSIENTMREKNE